MNKMALVLVVPKIKNIPYMIMEVTLVQIRIAIVIKIMMIQEIINLDTF